MRIVKTQKTFEKQIRIRIYDYKTLFRRRQKFGFTTQRYFMEWKDTDFSCHYHNEENGFNTRKEAEIEATKWLDRIEFLEKDETRFLN